LLSLLFGCLGIGVLRLSCLDPYIQQTRRLVLETKVALIQEMRAAVPKKYLKFLEEPDLSPPWNSGEELQLIIARLEERKLPLLLQENKELRKLLAMRTPQGFDPVGARILGKTDAHTHTLLLDVGTDQGVCLRAAVVTGEGFVGRIVQTGHNWSQVLLVTDGASRTPVVFYPSQECAVLVGDFSPSLKIDLLHNRHLNSKQTAFTSGLDGYFPKGVFIGIWEGGAQGCVVPAATVHNREFVCVLVPTVSTRRAEEHAD
jgi:hypothetical protein